MIVLSEFPIFYGALPKLNDEIEVGQKSYKLVQNSYKLVHQLVTNVPTLVGPGVSTSQKRITPHIMFLWSLKCSDSPGIGLDSG